jgi:hypothetical protein
MGRAWRGGCRKMRVVCMVFEALLLVCCEYVAHAFGIYQGAVLDRGVMGRCCCLVGMVFLVVRSLRSWWILVSSSFLMERFSLSAMYLMFDVGLGVLGKVVRFHNCL